MFIKLGEAIQIRPTDIQSMDIVIDSDLDIENRMKKFADELKVIAPKAKDFLYFTCVMMHAAEAALYDDNGEIKKDASGNPVEVRWEPVGKDSVKWVCSDVNLKPYKNNNSDIFSEAELKLAHRKWVGRPLCLDHQSQSVDKIRGVIVDTVYDEKRKRLIALCALDKKNYPDLAHKVMTGYATNVSMGTAVGRAICTECYRVARTESDFCDHMRRKTCYGEINLDLNPLELSLVVSGADPKAKVKHIIAKDLSRAAESLSEYIEKTQVKVSNGAIDKDELNKIKEALQDLMSRVEKLAASSDENDAVGPTRSTAEMQETNIPGTNFSFNPPEAFPSYASDLQKAILGIQVKTAKLQEDYDKLASLITSEDKMSEKKAYQQGTVERNPSGTTYPPEPGQEIRMQDKHMHGAGPFPGVGDVEGMYPGITESDEDRKKRLQRLAEEEERRILREAAVKKAKDQLQNKEAYFQGTEEPKTYSKDPLNEKARKEDKHMVGAPPFPGVGKVDGLYGDDLAVKEKLSRAALKAKFRKVSAPDGTSLDKAASRWDVYANDKLILSATVDQITRGNVDNMYDAVATEQFGKGLLTRIKVEGFNQVKDALVKQAQPAAAPAPMPPMPGPGAPADAAPIGEPEPPAEVGGGDKVDVLVGDLGDLGDELKEKISDLQEALGPVEEEAPELEGIPPAPESQFSEAKPQTVASLQSMRKTLNGMLTSGIKETVADLKAHEKEISVTRGLYADKYAGMNEEQRKYFNVLAADAVRDAKETIADSIKLMGAIVKYAHGTEELLKKAQVVGAGDATPAFGEQAATPASPIEGRTIGTAPNGIDFIVEKGDGTIVQQERLTGKETPIDPEAAAQYKMMSPGSLPADDGLAADDADLSVDDSAAVSDVGDIKIELDPKALEQSKVVSEDKPDLTTKEGRAVYRMKLAQKGLTWNDMPDRAHPDGSQPAPGVEVKPTAEFAKFHVLEDTHKAMMDLAALPPKVKKQAEAISQLVEAGQLDPSEVDDLAKFGVDPATIKYWKGLYGEAKDSASKEFAADLVKEHTKQKVAEEVQAQEVRIKRAYDLAYTMRDKGMIETNQVSDQVGEIMKWNDDGFNSVKNIVSRQPEATKKSSVPTVGLLSSGDVILPAAEAAQQSPELGNFLQAHFANRKF